ncbi:chemotaxis protein CheA [Methyloraptor flagellatus]|uniref:Chemotaxis protein CheA n=1 Tax=Methyloraptor flagellatus TaxID=3162530 RepID=A0AAU7XDA7_9HYPH
MTTGGQGGEYAQFKATFFEECSEILADLDGRLTRLQSEAIDAEELNAIFRAVHSIKAGAGAFNLGSLVGFSHTFEALLDWMRDGRITQNERVATAVVHAGDVLATLVAAAQTDSPVEPDFGADVAEELQALLDEAGRRAAGAAGAAPSATAGSAPARPPVTASGDARDAASDRSETPAAPALDAGITHTDSLTCYRIDFVPRAELFRHANEPLLLIGELQRLGTLETTLRDDRLPALADMDPEDAYFAWTFELVTDRPQSEIAEVFEFVDADCDLTLAPVLPAAGEDADDDDADGWGLFEPDAQDAEAEAGDHDAEPHAAGAEPSPTASPAAATRTPATPEAVAAAIAPTARPTASGAANAAQAKSSVSSIRVDLGRVDRLVNMVGELVITQAMLAQQLQESHGGDRESIRGSDELATLTRELQECVMAIRMQPVRSVFQRMPRLVREVSAKLDKHVRLVMSGEQTEVDKTVIEELADPLTHMIRNAIDHGIETPEARIAAGKPPEGTIALSAAHVGSNILIHLEDDGRGIDRERLLAKALAKGIIAADAKLSDEEIDDLIFSPGFSTAETVTDVSGRGVGMDVVRRNIVNLGGRIQVQSQLGKGTRFTLVIPLTLAVLDGMVVAVGAEKYILPLTSIIESFRPDKGQVSTLAGGGDVASIRGQFYRLVQLHRIFDVPSAITEPWRGIVVLVETASGEKIGIAVDELLGQQQVVIKSLQENYDPVAGISGATILGNGRVALILDIENLTRLPERPAGRRADAGRGPTARPIDEPADVPLALSA